MSILEDLDVDGQTLEKYLDKVDEDGSMRKAWSELEGAAFPVGDVGAPPPFVAALKAAPKKGGPGLPGHRLNPVELFSHLMKAFLNGPMSIAVGDIKTEVAQSLVLKKLELGGKLESEDCTKLIAGIVNLHASALYPLGYRYIYRYFDRLAAGLRIEPPDRFPVFPPSEDLIDLCAEIDQLYRGEVVSKVLADLQEAADDEDRAADPKLRAELRATLETSEEYKEYRQKTVKLIKTVLGPAATAFLFAALKSIPEVGDYLREVSGRPPLPPPEFVKVLEQAPAYVRVLVYVAEANDSGHAITGAHIPFPVETSESTSEWLDEMLSDLLGEKAQENPFSSRERRRIGVEAPLDVEADYERDMKNRKGTVQMNCPKDGAELKSTVYESEIEVDQCEECDGMWLDAGELEKIQQSSEHDYGEELREMPAYAARAYEMARQQAAPDLKCPKCGEQMVKKEYGYSSQIIIDTCLSCRGVWLDRGEIEALEVFFERSRAQTADIRKGFLSGLLRFFR